MKECCLGVHTLQPPVLGNSLQWCWLPTAVHDIPRCGKLLDSELLMQNTVKALFVTVHPWYPTTEAAEYDSESASGSIHSPTGYPSKISTSHSVSWEVLKITR